MINNEEDLESFMKSLENDLESITKKEEGKKSDQDLKPTSDKAFRDSINEFLKGNGPVIISANFWTLAEIASHLNPDAESFFKALDCDYIIGVLDICWAKACTIKGK